MIVSRIKCQNCQEMGHYKSKCTNPHVPEDGVDAGGADGAGGAGGAVDNWGAENATAGSDAGGGDWNTKTASW